MYYFSVLGLYKSWGASEIQQQPVPVNHHDKTLQQSDAYENVLENNEATKSSEILEAQRMIRKLEAKIRQLEGRMPRKHPDVNFLNYKNRKRILVSWYFMINIHL